MRVAFNRARTEPVRWAWGQAPGLDASIELRLHERFGDAPGEVRQAMASWIRSGKRARRACALLDEWIAAHIATLPRRKRNERLRPRGDHHDLTELAEELYRTSFADDFAPPAERPRITWGRRARSRSRGSLRLGSYDPEDHLVRLHVVLDRASVPAWFVRYVLFHEILHAALPPKPGPDGRRWIHHGPEFRSRERQYPDYRRAVEWEELHLPRLIRAARRITPPPRGRGQAPAPGSPPAAPAPGGGAAHEWHRALAAGSTVRMNSARFEYKFVRLGEGWLAVRSQARSSYQRVIQEHAAEGWRLVQVFSPGIGAYGVARFYELIFERPTGAADVVADAEE